MNTTDSAFVKTPELSISQWFTTSDDITLAKLAGEVFVIEDLIVGATLAQLLDEEPI